MSRKKKIKVGQPLIDPWNDYMYGMVTEIKDSDYSSFKYRTYFPADGYDDWFNEDAINSMIAEYESHIAKRRSSRRK